MAYITGAMTKLETSEVMSLQIIISPVAVRRASSIARRILHNGEMLHQLGRHRLPIIGILFNVVNGVLSGILDGIGDGVSSTHKYHKSQNSVAHHKQQAAMKLKPARVLSAFEQELAESIHTKLNQPLFRVNLRVMIAAKDKKGRTHTSVRALPLANILHSLILCIYEY